MRFERILQFSAVLSLTVFFASESRATEGPTEPPKSEVARLSRHRLSFGGGAAATYVTYGKDGYYQYTDGVAAIVRAGYAYRLVRGLEVGAGLGFYTDSLVFPAASVRAYLPLGNSDAVELGVWARPGMLLMIKGDP